MWLLLLYDYKSKLHKLVIYKKQATVNNFLPFLVFPLFQHYHDLHNKFYGKTIYLDKFSDLF